jgi:hypothetical protein
MKTWIRSALASCMLVSTFTLCAEDAAAPKPEAAKPAVEKPHAKPEGEKLTPEQRKEAREKAQARHKELQAKKDAGTLTDAEKKEFARLEKRGKGGKDAGPRKHKKHDEQPK